MQEFLKISLWTFYFECIEVYLRKYLLLIQTVRTFSFRRPWGSKLNVNSCNSSYAFSKYLQIDLQFSPESFCKVKGLVDEVTSQETGNYVNYYNKREVLVKSDFKM